MSRASRGRKKGGGNSKENRVVPRSRRNRKRRVLRMPAPACVSTPGGFGGAKPQTLCPAPVILITYPEPLPINPGIVLNSRTTTALKCEAIARRARI